MRRFWVTLPLMVAAAAPAYTQVPAGGTFVISVPPSMGSAPDAAADADGDFVVVMSGDDGNYSGAWARRISAAGDFLGQPFLVNTGTLGCQGTTPGPSVASDAAGSFVVAFGSFRCFNGPPAGDGSAGGVFARRFDSAGAPRGSDFLVNVYTTGHQFEPDASSDDAGDVIVVWTSEGQDGDGYGVFGRRYDRTSAPLGGEFQLSVATADNQRRPVVASDATGNFMVAWNVESASPQVWGRMFDASGAPRTGDFPISPGVGVGGQQVAAAGNGSFVVVWLEARGVSPPVPPFDVWARRYLASGAPLGAAFRVNTTMVAAFGPSVSAGPDGGFVVSWFEGTDPTGGFVRARRYDAAGAPRGPELVVSTLSQEENTVALDRNGNFLIAFYNVNLYGQRYGGLLPIRYVADAQPSPMSDGNGILEPGEVAEVVTHWRNATRAPQTFTGTAASFAGPSAPGVGYAALDPTGAYGTVPDGVTAPCTDCYAVSVTFGGTRPATHWDATLEERLAPDAQGQYERWRIHLGDSFGDVPRASVFYRFV